MCVFVACLFLATLFSFSSIFEKKKKTFVLFLVAARKDEKDTHTKPKHNNNNNRLKRKKRRRRRRKSFVFSLSLSPVRLNRTTGPSSPHRFEACAPRQRRSLRLFCFLFLRNKGVWGKQ